MIYTTIYIVTYCTCQDTLQYVTAIFHQSDTATTSSRARPNMSSKSRHRDGHSHEDREGPMENWRTVIHWDLS
jgi:hypothetical protein